MDMSPFSSQQTKDKSRRFYEPFSCRIIINSISGIARWITPSPFTSSSRVCRNRRSNENLDTRKELQYGPTSYCASFDDDHGVGYAVHAGLCFRPPRPHSLL